MFKISYFMVAFVGSLLCILSADAQVPLATASNAAAVLRRAIELMPEFTKEQKEWLRDGAGPADEDKAELLQSMEPSLQLLYRAADMPACYWELPWEEDGFNTKLTHLGPMISLAGMAQRHAEAQLPSNPTGFLEDSFVALSTARHTGRDGALISVLVEYAMESRSVDSLARHLPDLPPETLASLAAQWKQIPPGSDLRDAILMEKAYGVDGFIKKILKAMEKVRAGRTKETRVSGARGADPEALSVSPLAGQFRLCGIVEIDGLPIRIGLETRQGNSFFLWLGQKKHGLELLSADFERGEAVLVKDGQAALLKLESGEFFALDLNVPDEVLAELDVFGPDGLTQKEWKEIERSSGKSSLQMLHDTSAFYERMVEALSFSPDEFQQWHTRFQEEVLSSNPFAALMIPSIDGAKEKADTVRVRSQMLMAAIEVMQFGPEAVEESLDPFGNGPFAYRETDHGFKLVSALSVRGKPVMLTVGNESRP